MSAVAAARLIEDAMARQKDKVATGLRISEASHNAAYWSISTGMRSDARAVSAVGDALGLAAAKTDVAYSGMTQVADILSEVKARLVAAIDNPEYAGAIQLDIAQMAAHARQIAGSSSFGGQNWLSTDIADMFDPGDPGRRIGLTSSFSKTPGGEVRVGSIDLDLARVSLFNSEGGGILQADPRSPYTIGGIRVVDVETGEFATSNIRTGSRAMEVFSFSGPVDLSGGRTITFEITVDADAPGLPAPRHGGVTTAIAIDEALVNSAVPGANGVISGYREMAAVLSKALAGTGAAATLVADSRGRIIPDRYALLTREDSGLDGSSVAISGLSDAAGGLREFETFGSRGNSITLAFSPFRVWEDVGITFEFFVNGSTQNVAITKDIVDSALGKVDGRVETAAEMAALLQAVVGMPGLLIEAAGLGVTLRTDDSDRLNGQKSRIGFRSIEVDIEPIPAIGLEDIDLAANPHMAKAYLASVDAMLMRVIDGAAVLGALKKRIGLQADFIGKLQDSISRGVAHLVDADMQAESARMAALEVQRQVAVQAMSIANAMPKAVLQLFRDIRA